MTDRRSRDARWLAGFARLRAYRAAHGDLNIPARHVESDGFRLGQLVWYLRHQARRGRLDRTRIAALDTLGFAWRPREAEAAQGRREIQKALRLALASPQPALRETPEARLLRRAYRRECLSRDEIAQLEAAGFEWSQSASKRAAALTALADYEAQHGRPPPRSYRLPGGYVLGEFAYNSSRREGQVSVH